MKAINGFYTVEFKDKSDTGFSFLVSFNPEHDIFKGHFPQQPVVPGVCSIQILKNELSAIFMQEIRFHTLQNVKYLQPLLPENKVLFDVKYLKNELGVQVHCTCAIEEKVVTKISALLYPL